MAQADLGTTTTDEQETAVVDDAAPDATRDDSVTDDAADDGWYWEDDDGWMRQRQAWASNGVYVVLDEHHCAPQPVHRAVNSGFGLGLCARGAYLRESRGTQQVVDANTGFLRYAGDEVGVQHFTGLPGSVTFIGADPAVEQGWFDDVGSAPAFTVTPKMAITHLRLLRAQQLDADRLTLESLALDLVTDAVSQHRGGINSYARRSTGDSRRRLVTDACELLHHPSRKLGLVEIARTIGCSPFHLSRVFHEITGLTIPEYRKRLRVHEALRRLNDGEHDLASIAMASGFADHSHMTRTIVAEFGDPPSRLRQLLQVYTASARLLPR